MRTMGDSQKDIQPLISSRKANLTRKLIFKMNFVLNASFDLFKILDNYQENSSLSSDTISKHIEKNTP